MRRVALCVLASTACSGTLPWFRGDLANHPPALVGEWVDVQKTTISDSSIWVLKPNGYDGGVRITRSSPSGRPHIEQYKYGYWYVRRDAGRDIQELCVSRRPGREAPSCTIFRTMIDSTAMPPRRAIRLAAYAGAHHTGDRLLIERR